MNNGWQGDPVVRPGARVEVHWRTGWAGEVEIDKECYGHSYHYKYFAATVQGHASGGGYILKYDAHVNKPFQETSRKVTIDKEHVYDCRRKLKMEWRLLKQQPRPADVNAGAASTSTGGELAAFHGKLSNNVCTAVSLLPDMTADQRKAVCNTLLEWGATTRADVFGLLDDTTSLTAVSEATESAGVKRIMWIKLKKACAVAARQLAEPVLV